MLRLIDNSTAPFNQSNKIFIRKKSGFNLKFDKNNFLVALGRSTQNLQLNFQTEIRVFT